VRIAVSDTGIGIAESDLPRLFEEFRQAGAAGRGERKGTGLGLAITKRLVELIGGRIDVISQLGQGSTFAVTIPVEIEGRAAPESDLESPLVDPERTALIIDSDPASLFITKKYLGEAGYSVAATDDPTRAVEIARIGKPSVIILDLDSMESGIELLEQIGKVEKGRILIAMSADSSTSNVVIEKGASIFMRKPIERSQLIGLVNKRDHAQANSSVLVVDDDPDARDLVVAMIGDRGYQIRTAANGREALELIAHTRPDAIILDLMLPEMDGFEVIHRMSLNPQWRSIPVILVTARDLSHEERRALDIGSARLIPKGTFTRDELLAELGVAMSGEVNAEAAPAEV
jgi:CheY-like chemotaxis protein